MADTQGSIVIAGKTPAPLSPGKWEGDMWVQENGYRVHRKWVERFPHLYGPCRQDPDNGQGNLELDDVLTKALEKINGLGSVYSTWSERHSSETAFYIAYNFIESSDDVPPVPDFWLAEAHYWFMHITAGRLLKKEKVAEAGKAAADAEKTVAQSAVDTLQTWTGLITANPEVSRKVLSIAVSALAAGGIILPPVIQAILKSLGVS